MALVPLAPIASAPNVSTQPLATVRLQSAGPSQGMQMAEAIGQVGAVAANLHAKYAELTDTRNLIEAEEVMRAKTQEFNTWRRDPANADESQWLPKWQEMQNATQKHIDGLKITDRARLNLSRSFGQWADKQTISVQGDAFKNAGRRTGAALQLRIEQGEGLGDDGQIESSYGAAVKTGVMLPEEAELAKFHSLKRAKATRVGQFDAMLDADMSAPDVDWQEIRERVKGNPELTDSEKKIKLANIESTHVRRASMDEVQALTLTNPTEAAKRLESGEWASIPDGDRQVAIAKAKEVRAAGASDTFRDTLTRIELGQAKPTEEFNAPDMQDITPLMRDILKAKNAEYHSKELKATRIALMNSPAVYENAVGVIAKYDSVADIGGLRKAEIGAALEHNFSGTYLEELKGRLDDRVTPKDPSMVDAAPALALLQEWTEGGGLGEYKVPMTQDGAPVMTDPKKVGTVTVPGQTFLGMDWLNPDDAKDVLGESKPVTTVDPMRQAQAAAKQATIRKTIEAEMKAGKFKTNDEVLARTVELFQQHGGKAPTSSTPAQSGANLLLPPPDKAIQDALKILNFQPAK